MPEVVINIGGRSFEVACQEGEEHFLHSAAKLLDNEATTLSSQIGRMPEPQMLLMAGLMLADKTAGLEEKLVQAQAILSDQERRISELENAPKPAPEKVEVAVLPDGVVDTFAELAARAEALAETVDPA
jgi:cell division protein ZapA